MKHRIPHSWSIRLPVSVHTHTPSYRKRKRFLACARNAGMGKRYSRIASFLTRKGFVCRHARSKSFCCLSEIKRSAAMISPCQGRHGKYLKNYSRKFHVGVLASAWDLRHFVMPRISLCISESACFRQSGTVQGSSHSELPCELPLVSLLQIVPENVRNCKNGHIGRWPNAVRRRY